MVPTCKLSIQEQVGQKVSTSLASWRLLFQKQNQKGGGGDAGDVAQWQNACLVCRKALGSTPSTGKEGREGERSGGREGKLKITESRVKREGEKKLPPPAGRIQGRPGTATGKKSSDCKGSSPSYRPHTEASPFTEARKRCLPHLPFPRPGAAVPKYHFVCWASMRDPKPTQQKYEGSRSPPCLFS